MMTPARTSTIASDKMTVSNNNKDDGNTLKTVSFMTPPTSTPLYARGPQNRLSVHDLSIQSTPQVGSAPDACTSSGSGRYKIPTPFKMPSFGDNDNNEIHRGNLDYKHSPSITTVTTADLLATPSPPHVKNLFVAERYDVCVCVCCI